jgi:hypothetical protein
MLTWNGEELDSVNFGIPDEEGNNNTTMFAQSWATFYEKDEETGKYTDVEIAPHDGRWLYLVVSGLGGDMVGELTVKPVIAASGVEINGEDNVGVVHYHPANAVAYGHRLCHVAQLHCVCTKEYLVFNLFGVGVVV